MAVCFPGSTLEVRREKVLDNRQTMDEALELDVPCLVLVGGFPQVRTICR
ncbi:hypothetical protein [Yersinia bercovieri]|nr:hypothetical protein [Yersinia bercovieri]